MEACCCFFVLQYVWYGGQRGDVHRRDGLQHSGQLGGPDWRHRCHSRTAGQATQYNAQRRGQCVTSVVLRVNVLLPSFSLSHLTCVSSLWQSFDFRSIRVDSPLLLIVNGRKQSAQSQIATSISYKPQRE